MTFWQRISGFGKKSFQEDVISMLRYGSTSLSGETVNLRRAIETPAVLACARVISEGLAQVPLKIYRRAPDGSREHARDHPAYRLLHDGPANFWGQTSFELREQIGLHLALTNNAYVVKSLDTAGRLLELNVLEPGAVTVERLDDYTLKYIHNARQGQQAVIPAENMWHVRGPSWNGWSGMDAIGAARNVIGLALSTERFASSMFLHGARLSGVLTSDTHMSPDKHAEIREQWENTYEGPGNFMRTALLSGGLKYQPLSQTAQEAQFTETRKAIILDVCRMFRVLPIMIMHDENQAGYASVEQRFLAHVTHTMMPWYERFEHSANINLLTLRERQQGYYFKHVVNGLMRGTAKERAEYHQILRQNGVETVNEWRESEDMDLSTDPAADLLRPAANLYGPPEELEDE